MNKYSENILSKSREDKYELVIKGNREFLYSGWEINQITTHLNNSYYKNELINTIKSELLNGTNPENIWILNESIKLNNTYENIKSGLLNLNLENDIIQLYYLGSPIPLIPHKDTYKIFYIFELLRIIYTMSNSNKLTPINRKESLKKLITGRNTFNNSNDLRIAVKELLIDSNEDKLKKDSSLLQNIEKITNANLRVFRYWDELIEEDNFDDIIINDAITDNITKEYIYRFKNTFKSFEKPIVCVYKPEINQIEITCIDMIARSYFNEGNARLLETKSISQNSPLLIYVGISMGFLPALMRLTEATSITRNTRRELVATIDEIDNNAEILGRQIEENDRIIQELRQMERLTNEKSADIQTTNRSDVAFNYVEEMEKEDMETLEKQFKSKKLAVEQIG
ncbi:hypothetical protein ABD91_16040 [Lysinibacillus sphaericus]|nr:hypothetical protein [Lysinibacillus sphaericus]